VLDSVIRLGFGSAFWKWNVLEFGVFWKLAISGYFGRIRQAWKAPIDKRR
jgi:hypothetical protein